MIATLRRRVMSQELVIPDYLCFTALEAGTFTLTIGSNVTSSYLSYIEWSKDGRNWNRTDVTSSEQTIEVSVVQDDKVYWRGRGNAMSKSYAAANSSRFSSDCQFNASGNLMSLLTENFETVTSWRYTSAFSSIFNGCTTLISAKDMTIPLTTLNENTFQSTFSGATAMTSALTMNVSDIGADCFNSAFSNCSSLVDVSGLKMTLGTLPNKAFYYAFANCSSLVLPPPITFTSLDTTKEQHCYRMFDSCTSLTSSFTLMPATLATACYQRMFYGCSSLNYVKCLATDISATNCLANWLYNVSPTGTFIQAEGVTWPRGINGIPTGWVDVEKRTMPTGYKQVESITPTIGSYFQLTAYAMDNHYSIEIGYRGSSEEIADATHQHQFAGYNLTDGANLKQMCGFIYMRQNTGAQVWAQRNAGVYTNPNTGQQSINSGSLTSTFTLDTKPHTFVYLPDSSAESIKFIIDGTVVQTSDKTYYDKANQNPISTGAPYKLYKITSLYSLQRGTTYYLKGYASDNTTLVTDCVPCIRTSDNKVGLYDFVESTFEEGTGTFTAGEEI